ncbi:hypothetical protein WJX84_005981, partial [Apatococcus fuscideae]
MCVNLQKYSNQFLTTARFVFRLPSAVVRTDKGTTRHEGADESSRPAQHGSARFCDMGRTLYDVLVLPTEAALADFCQSLRLKRAAQASSQSSSLPAPEASQGLGPGDIRRHCSEDQHAASSLVMLHKGIKQGEGVEVPATGSEDSGTMPDGSNSPPAERVKRRRTQLTPPASPAATKETADATAAGVESAYSIAALHRPGGSLANGEDLLLLLRTGSLAYSWADRRTPPLWRLELAMRQAGSY